MTERKLDARVCVVSGSGRGIGREIARLFARQGAKLVLCSRTERELQTTADELRDAFGVEVLTEQVDVADPAAVAAMARLVAETMGPAHVLVNNAGVLGPVGRIDQLDLMEWRHAVDANVAGVANMCAAFVPAMAEHGGGAIVNLSGGGIGGSAPSGFMSAYTTSKVAVVGLTETLAEELAPVGIRINATAPGAVATELMRPALDAGPEVVGERLHERSRQIYERGAVVELPDEFAQLLLFLVAEQPAWLTGRLLSARWDSVDRLQAEADSLGTSSLFTLRRIDGDLFGELERQGE